jgi:pilus assembly protein Flp/PilA
MEREKEGAWGRMGYIGWAKDRLSSEAGATAIEYALMVALIAAVVIVAVTFLGLSTRDVYQNVGDAVSAT